MTNEQILTKAIEGYPGYTVQPSGRVWSSKSQRFLKPGINNAGYQVVDLHKDGKRRRYFVHRLVASAFVPNNREVGYVNHKDGCKGHNNASNLEWCTHKENMRHAWESGLLKQPPITGRPRKLIPIAYLGENI